MQLALKRILFLFVVIFLMMSLLPIGTFASDGRITIRIHYHRPDGDYKGWTLWAWDRDGYYSVTGTHADYGIPCGEPPYKFVDNDDEVVATISVPTGTSRVGYQVRYGDWEDKDIEYDQFINISGILSGTIDFYIESGIPSQPSEDDIPTMGELCNKTIQYNGHAQQVMVLNSDVICGIIVTSAEYDTDRNGDPVIKLYLSAAPEHPITEDTFEIRSQNNISAGITDIKYFGSTFYIYLDQELPQGKVYAVVYEGREYPITMPFSYTPVITAANYDHASQRISLNLSPEPNFDEISSSSFSVVDLSNNSIVIEQLAKENGTYYLCLQKGLKSGVSYTVTFNDSSYTVSFTCDHASHNTDGYCTLCEEHIGHSYENGSCACGAEELDDPTPPADNVDHSEPTDHIENTSGTETNTDTGHSTSTGSETEKNDNSSSSAPIATVNILILVVGIFILAIIVIFLLRRKQP